MADLAIDKHGLQYQFLGWQCRARQLLMRQQSGRPDEAIMPVVSLAANSEACEPHDPSAVRVITLISKRKEYSQLPEIKQIFRQTQDPAGKRDNALKFFSERYYQRADEFSATLTATFGSGSALAASLLQAGRCRLGFSAYNQSFDLHCSVTELDRQAYLYQTTWWHNIFFNPGLHPDTRILAFQPDWEASH